MQYAAEEAHNLRPEANHQERLHDEAQESSQEDCGQEMAEMRFSHFLAAIFLGRFLRFVVESFLVIRFGPEIVGLLGGVLLHHWRYVIAVIATACLIGWWIWRTRKLKSAKNNEQLAD